MAQRRMFNVKLCDSARFLRMPLSTQALYFHLGLRADDEGIVEAFTVLRISGASEDDLKLLVAKGYITILNDEFVSYINDWTTNNLIRADRKVESIYKDLLIKVKSIDVQDLQPSDNQMSDIMQPSDNQMPAQVSIGKISIGKENNTSSSSDDGKSDISSNNSKKELQDQIESLWKMYPNKRGKAIAIKKLPKLIKQHGYEQLVRCIERYSNACKGKEKQYIKHGDTFFNSGYMDYLDDNYEEQEEKREKIDLQRYYSNGNPIPVAADGTYVAEDGSEDPFDSVL